MTLTYVPVYVFVLLLRICLDFTAEYVRNLVTSWNRFIMRGYKDKRLQNQPWRARSCSSKAHQSWLSSGPSHMMFHHVLSFGQMFIHSIRAETPTTLRLSIAISSWQHFPAFYLPGISFSSSDFFLYLKVDNFRHVLLLVAHGEFSILPAGKKSRSV